MAYYIEDKHIIEVALSDEGLKLIVDKIQSYGYDDVKIEQNFESEKGVTSFSRSVLVQVPVIGMGGGYNNIIGISSVTDRKGSLYINPIDSNGKMVTAELRDFIQSEMISIIRNRKLDEIL